MKLLGRITFFDGSTGVIETSKREKVEFSSKDFINRSGLPMPIRKVVLRCDCTFDTLDITTVKNCRIVGTAKNVRCIRTPLERAKFEQGRREMAEEQTEKKLVEKTSQEEPRLIAAQPKEIVSCRSVYEFAQKFTLDEILGGKKTTNVQDERAGQSEKAVEGETE